MATPTDTLSNTPPPPAEAAPPAADAREQVQQATRDALTDLRTAIDSELDRFKTRVKEEGSDFVDSDEDLEKSDGFKAARNGLRSIFENDASEGPEDIKNEWRKAMREFMVAKISSYEGSWGVMKTTDVDNALKELMEPSGIGSFEQWINKPDNPHKTAYEKWKAEQTRKAQETKVAADVRTAEEADRTRQTNALAAQKQEFIGAVSNLEARLTTLPQAIIPEILLIQVRDLQTRVNGDDGSHLDAHRAEMTDLDAKIRPYEDRALWSLAENPDIPEARKSEILTLVREGKKDPAEAKRDLEAALQAANLPVAVDEEAPIGDRLLGWANSMQDGAMKKLALGLASFFATLCTTKWIGGWFRGKLMSNRTLAEKFGDAEAAKAVKTEQEFRRFGLPENLVSDLGGKKTKEVLALMRQKPAEITKDTAQQGKLAKLADNIEAKNGATNDDTLVNFMSDGNIWKDIVYPGATAGAVATAASETAPTQTPSAPAESPDTKVAKIFEGMTPDDRTAIEGAKAKEVAAGTLPPALQNNTRAQQIVAKLKTHGATEATVDPNQTVRQFIEAHLDKDWTIV